MGIIIYSLLTSVQTLSQHLLHLRNEKKHLLSFFRALPFSEGFFFLPLESSDEISPHLHNRKKKSKRGEEGSIDSEIGRRIRHR